MSLNLAVRKLIPRVDALTCIYDPCEKLNNEIVISEHKLSSLKAIDFGQKKVLSIFLPFPYRALIVSAGWI